MACTPTSSFTTPLSIFNSSTRRNVRFPSRISAAYASIDRSASTSTSSPYEILGIRATASCQEIKQAYRKLARVSHPDVASSGDDEFMRIHSAYATLSDPEKRADYDQAMVGTRRGATATASYAYARSAGTMPFSHRRWETDQCW